MRASIVSTPPPKAARNASSWRATRYLIGREAHGIVEWVLPRRRARRAAIAPLAQSPVDQCLGSQVLIERPAVAIDTRCERRDQPNGNALCAAARR